MGFRAFVMDLLFPPKCVFCGRVLLHVSDVYCARCERDLPFTEGQDSVWRGEGFDLCAAPLYYRDEVRKSILRFKFKGRSGYAECYGKVLADCIRKHLSGGYDIISWVPLSEVRAKTRGYDQAMLLALAAALELDDVAAETLRKTRDARAQSSLSGRDARAANISGAYEAADPELIAGKRVLLIDDIFTTGSTLAECARTLTTAGAAAVCGVALAKA
ncbi:MAG: double zinc ribbon domain-containing protein [Oscillospiraceae bacterium]|jgi:ComF family protein|nr:double zinc ribbon domain-containing protein [Oscillospiraceae bacterium]